MRITGLHSQSRRNSRRVSVYLDGVFAFGLAQETVQALGLCEGMDVERSELDRICREDQLHHARNYAYLLLSYKARTSAELRERLVRKGFSPDVVSSTLERLGELGLVNDEQFARQFTEDRVVVGHKGTWRVRAELRKRGVAREQIEQAIAAAPDETAAAREVVLKFRARNKRLEPDVLRRRLYGFLARRGFSVDTIRQVLDVTDEEA
jgi:regulatory protein